MMRIEFFETGEGFDDRAIRGGIYHIELVRKKEPFKRISLYIGESV